jgi:enoyl-CoA hydratase/carnithine racemase
MSMYHGEALGWARIGDALEVTLHRDPCNEIGTVALEDLERLADCLSSGALGAQVMIMHSVCDAGFCAGADLRELWEGLDARQDRVKVVEEHAGRAAPLVECVGGHLVKRELRQFVDRVHAAFNAIDSAPLLTIAATHGVVFGGGFELALTCDLIVADRSTRFCFPELRLGLIPGFGGIPRLRRDVGNAVVRDLLCTGRSLGAKRAHQVGLVSQLAARGEALTLARSLAEQASRFDGHTLREGKAFAKPIPYAELEREKDLFCDLVTRPTVFEALSDFVSRDDPYTYLP